MAARVVPSPDFRGTNNDKVPCAQVDFTLLFRVTEISLVSQQEQPYDSKHAFLCGFSHNKV